MASCPPGSFTALVSVDKGNPPTRSAPSSHRQRDLIKGPPLATRYRMKSDTLLTLFPNSLTLCRFYLHLASVSGHPRGQRQGDRPRRPAAGDRRRNRSGVFHRAEGIRQFRQGCARSLSPRPIDDDLRGVRAGAARGRVQRGTAGAQTEHQEMSGVRCCGESAGADEEGPHEVGGRRLSPL